MDMDPLERGVPAHSHVRDDWLLNPSPKVRGLTPILAVAAVIGTPLSLAAGYIVTGRAIDGLLALPLLVACVGLLLQDKHAAR